MSGLEPLLQLSFEVIQRSGLCRHLQQACLEFCRPALGFSDLIFMSGNPLSLLLDCRFNLFLLFFQIGIFGLKTHQFFPNLFQRLGEGLLFCSVNFQGFPAGLDLLTMVANGVLSTVHFQSSFRETLS